jgi:hypothetical protein
MQMFGSGTLQKPINWNPGPIPQMTKPIQWNAPPQPFPAPTQQNVKPMPRPTPQNLGGGLNLDDIKNLIMYAQRAQQQQQQQPASNFRR